VGTDVVTRGDKLVLAPSTGQVGSGPAFEAKSGQFGLPFSGSWGLIENLEVGGSFNMLLRPFAANTMFVSDMYIYGRYRVKPGELSIEATWSRPGPLVNGTGMNFTAKAPALIKLSETQKLYVVADLGISSNFLGLNTRVAGAATYMHLLNDLFYAQGILNTSVEFGQGLLIPGRNLPLIMGVGGGYLKEENEGIGLALNLGLGGTAGTGALQSVGFLATYVKAI